MIILNINIKSVNGIYPLLLAVRNDDAETINLIMDYANRNDIILNINEKDNTGAYPLLLAINKNNIHIIKQLIDYSVKKDVILNINESDINDNSIINTSILELLNRYGNEHNLNFMLTGFSGEINNIDEGVSRGINCFVCEKKTILDTINDSKDNIKVLLENAKRNKKIVLNINEKDSNGWYPLLLAIRDNNILNVKLLIDYSNDRKEMLEINGKNNIDGSFPLLLAIRNNNFEIVQLLVEYAKKIILF